MAIDNLLDQSLPGNDDPGPEVVHRDVEVDRPALVALRPEDVEDPILKVDVLWPEMAYGLAADAVGGDREEEEEPVNRERGALGVDDDPPALLDDDRDLLLARGVVGDVPVPRLLPTIVPERAWSQEVDPSRRFPVPLQGGLDEHPRRPGVALGPGRSRFAELLYEPRLIVSFPYLGWIPHHLGDDLDPSAVPLDGPERCSGSLEVVDVFRHIQWFCRELGLNTIPFANTIHAVVTENPKGVWVYKGRNGG